MKEKLRSIISILMVLLLVVGIMPNPIIAKADNTSEYPYTIFAISKASNSISINSSNVNLNGSIATNGTVAAEYSSVTQKCIEHANEEMFCTQKLESICFSDKTITNGQDYVDTNLNIHIDQPVVANGCINLKGNANLKSSLKAMSDITITGENLNATNSIIFSKYGDIAIDCSNTGFCGFIYAPFGDVRIKSNNLNLNSIVIIAQTVTLVAPSININYNRQIAELIGNASESPEIPAEDWAYLGKDSDNDTLPDVLEKVIGTNPVKADTDDDGLPDNYELYYTKTSPVTLDTDNNGVLDGEEDFDNDSLTNIEELANDTDPNGNDSDDDGLLDGEEISKYKTIPNEKDTDSDGLIDGDEIILKTNPLNPDTNGNSVLDGDEMFYQELSFASENKDCPITEVDIDMNCTGNINRNTFVDSIMGDDAACSEVAGLIGEPFEITSDAKFDKAKITFKLDESKINTDLEDILFLWYDEESSNFVELDTACNKKESTVSIQTEHFSKYMIVDKNTWFKAWAKELKYNKPGSSTTTNSFDTILAIDCSGSMDSNDPISYMNNVKSCQRMLAAKGFINNMGLNDKVGIVLFEVDGEIVAELSNDKSILNTAISKIHNGGGTEFDSAITESLKALKNSSKDSIKKIILLSDGGSSISNSVLESAKDNNVAIYTVGLGKYSSDYVLQRISTATGGKFYKAITASDLVDIYTQAGINFDNIDKTDKDNDGLYDIIETVGIRLFNGTIIYTDPTKADTDGDGLKDGEEISTVPIPYSKLLFGSSIGSTSASGYYFAMKSNPNKRDSDDDFIDDTKDTIPLSINYSQKELKSKAAKVVKKNATYIKDAANHYDIPPCIAAACIFTEQDLNVDWKDKYLDGIVGFYGVLDTSIGLGQVRISTAKFVEDKGYVPKCKASDGGWDIPFFGHLNGTVNMSREKRLENNEWNSIYVAAYLTYFWDIWKNDFPTLRDRPDIWASLYNLGHEKTHPHPKPESNKFGRHAEKYYNMMYLLLYK